MQLFVQYVQQQGKNNEYEDEMMIRKIIGFLWIFCSLSTVYAQNSKIDCSIQIENVKFTPESHVTGVDSKVEKLIILAKSKMGDSYEPAKAGPDHFDCSGFVYYVFKNNGISIPRSSLTQSQSGEQLSRKEIQRGDILFFDTHDRKHINHSGIYLGKGKFIHSSSGKAYGVTISELDKGFYKDKFRWGIRKIKE